MTNDSANRKVQLCVKRQAFDRHSINVALRCVGIALALIHGPALAEPRGLDAEPSATRQKAPAPSTAPTDKPQTGQPPTLTSPKPSAPSASAPDAKNYPPLVEDMRELIGFAVRSGNIDDLSLALDASIHPTHVPLPKTGTSRSPSTHPGAIATLKALSHDGTGRDMLARMGAILSLPASKLPVGPDYENQDVYVWPYLAERRLGDLTPAEIVDLYRLAPAPIADAWRRAESWGGDRLLIGADGGWLAFLPAPSIKRDQTPQ